MLMIKYIILTGQNLDKNSDKSKLYKTGVKQAGNWFEKGLVTYEPIFWNFFSLVFTKILI